ncbi:T6SS phospholipase effector Tle1-like catalytic domain-containing protein [Paraburkholderia sacchari]|uniref:T6SS phospholipase effector Tle1-like catalytic domain-containing protein n=1 Tax=Paraburkholderia sacchari TaxID=159450 RepID=UPI0039A5E0F1
MQDWFTDSHETFEQTFKTMTELYAEEFKACTTCEQRPWFSFFFDGTGNNRRLDAEKKKWSNVARLFEGHIEDDPLVAKLYYPGVGTPLDASNPNWIDSVRDSEALGGGTGAGGAARLNVAESDLNKALEKNHRVIRIDVAVFGFSRGAALARAFVNRILDKCEYRDGQPYWPCGTALDGKAAPIHFRFLGIFDTVESVGVPAHNLAGMKMAIPDEVENCLHLVAGHEIRTAFALTRLGGTSGQHREIVYPGVHSDLGGGYRPGEQGRSDMLARLPLNRMRLEAAMAGVPFTPPADLSPKVASMLGYDRAVKDGFDEYMSAVDIGGTLDEQIAAHMRLYYGWLSARYNADPCKVYEGICALPADGQTRAQAEAELAGLRQSMSSIDPQASDLNWRSYMQALAKSNPAEYQERIKLTSAPAPLSPDEEAYYQAWLNPPKLSPGLMHFFDTYIHDSRAGFTVPIVRGMYLTRRLVITPTDEPRTAVLQSVPTDTGAAAAASPYIPGQSPQTSMLDSPRQP